MDAGSVEMFQKQPLTLPSKSERSRGKPRRREVSRSRSAAAGQKVKKQDIVKQIKAKEQLMEACSSENQSIGLISRTRLTHKLGIYSKGKTSETISRRKALSDLKLNTGEATTRRDLKRVLGQVSPPLQEQHVAKKHSPSPESTRMEVETQHSANNPQGCVVPLAEISHRLADSLNVENFFPGTKYLYNCKRELRKLMRQSDPVCYTNLVQSLSDDATTSSKQDGSSHENKPSSSQLTELAPTDTLSSLALLFGDGSDLNPHLPIPHSIPPPPPPPPTLPVPLDPTTFPQPPPPPNAPCPPINSSVMDFLDMFETNPPPPPPSPSMTSEVVIIPHSPRSHWLATPDRPRMYPRKLY